MTDHTHPCNTVGNYRLHRLLGTGSYGKVYLAQSMKYSTNSPVALKILQVRCSAPAKQKIFLKEARLLERLKHPHLLRILETGIHKNNPYIVQEYAPSGSLRTCLQKENHLPLPTVLGYLHQAALALTYLHTQGVIHHDIKPENIFFDTDGKLLLADFGIATLTTPFKKSAFTASTSIKKEKRTQLGHTKTSPGTLNGRGQYMLTDQLIQTIPLEDCHAEVGTQGYMAPEQLEGNASTQSDQYALAIVAYELLTGRTPLKQITPVQEKEQLPEGKHLHNDTDKYPALPSAIPPALEAVILKALSKNPNDRFETIMAFANALEAAVMGERPLPQHRQEDQGVDQKYQEPFILAKANSYDKPYAFHGKRLGGKTESTVQEKETSFLLTSCITEPYIEKALASLPWIERNCLLLSTDAELTPVDIADILDLDEQAIQTLLRHATHQWLQTYQVLLKKELGISLELPRASYGEEYTQVKRLIQNASCLPTT